ncbi:uncharacterized protein LOC128635840 isoform X2 [Bombina bombina]|uniref:uncharacterized protein LOC128635840 isoform X2 n=1 Tax=Bombina bombina TaxID=8345 RepID=UPI00235A6A8D|nr:uncharacterized protein LOC128635840 isoform X2 [Bombina bombina]
MGTMYLLLLFTGVLAGGQAQRHFVTAFLENYDRTSATTFQLYIITYNNAASVTVTVAQPSFNQTVVIERDKDALVTLSYDYMIYEKDISSKAVIVTSDANISVYAFYTKNNTADAMVCLPQEELGTEYYIFTPGTGGINQFAVANGINDAVSVNITVSGTIIFNGTYYGSKDKISISLAYQQVIQFQSTSDLTGTRISSSAPVAVFMGNKCFAGPGTTCDVLVEQLYPVQNWGRYFAVFPLLNHTSDIIDIIAAYSDTRIFIEGSKGNTTQYNLAQGSHVKLTLQDRILVNSSKPIMISYLIQQSTTGPVPDYDPFLTTVPPIDFKRNYYKFVTYPDYYNYLLIVSQSSADTDFFLDHHPLNLNNAFVSELNGIKAIEVSLGKIGGQHEIYNEASAFVIYVYGIYHGVSYGYSVGQEKSYPDPPLPNATEEPDNPVVLDCLPHGAVYQIPLRLVLDAQLSVQDIHLEDPLCQAVEQGNFAIINVPFNSCGSRVLDEDGKIFYVNTVYGTIPDTSIHRIEVPVQCEMAGNETLGINFHPKVTDVVSQGHYNISLKLYEGGDYIKPIALYPFEIDLPGNIYVEFQVDSDDKDLQIITENCKSSPTLEDTAQSYNLIEHGCFLDSTLHGYLITDNRQQRFSFHVFKFDDFQEVYLACNVVICHKSSVPNRCTQGCLNRRHKRNIHSPESKLGTARLSQGPVVFKKEHQHQQQHDNNTLPLSSFVGALCVFGLMSVAVLILQKRYYQKQGYSLLPNTSNIH